MTTMNRRELLRDAGLGLAGSVALPGIVSEGSTGTQASIVIGVIGCGGMGSNHIRGYAARPDVQVAYLCDADSDHLASAVKAVEAAGKKTPATVKDMRRVFDDRAVDAVVIATPDHWHAPAAILACEAGKHVYVEKPCSHNIREGRLMVEAARRNNRVVQVGMQSRSAKHIREAVQALREGVIGDVLIAKAWNSQRRANIGKAGPGMVPANLDYDLWVGPAPMVPFQPTRHHYTWHWWYDFGTGDMGNDGVHDLDIARWGLGVGTHPSTVTASGGKFFFDDDQQFPDTQYVIFDYPGDGRVGHKRQLIYEHRIWSPYHQEGYENGNAFYGTKGVMILGKSGGWKVIHEGNKPGPSKEGSLSLPDHYSDFLDSIRTGKRPNGDIEVGHFSASLCHLGNIASRVGRVIHFDPNAEKITGDDRANALVRRRYREGHWAVPKGV
jgi:predicted dehydrogenase